MTSALEVGEWAAARPSRTLPPGKYPVTIVQKAGWAPGPVSTGAENLARTGIRSPDRPACSQSLYRLSYRAHNPKYVQNRNKHTKKELRTRLVLFTRLYKEARSTKRKRYVGM
jgi:hypothetical protein